MTMKILGLDLETAPGTFWAWRTGQQFVSLDMMVQPPHMLCFGARFQDQKRVGFFSEWDHGHEEMVRQAHRLLDEADVVLHFNGKRFDVPWLNAEMAQLGLTPPSPFKQIDLYQQSKQFYLASHKLQHVSTHLAKVEGKVQTGGFGLWRAVMAGDEKAQRLMRRYQLRDVDVLFEVYDVLRPWLKLPNANLYNPPGTPSGCPTPGCGRTDAFQWRGYERLRTGTYKRRWCNPELGGCGRWSRDTRRVDDNSATSSSSIVEVSQS